MRPTDAVDVGIRPYVDADEPGVLGLLDDALGGGPAGRRTAELFRWKHVQNPFGRSLMLVAEADDRIVGLRAFMRWRFRAGTETVEAVRAVDTATHPDYQGQGIFSRLTREGLVSLLDEGRVAFVFNTPNEKTLPGYLKMGWQSVGRLPVSVKVRRPVAFLRGIRSLAQSSEPGNQLTAPVRALPAAEAFVEGSDLAALVSVSGTSDSRFATALDLEYLRWRYANAPLLDYRVVGEEKAGRLTGLAVFRVRSRGRLVEATICDMMVRAGEKATAARLLRCVARSVDADHLTCHFPRPSIGRAGALRTGFIPTGRGVTLVVNPLRPTPHPPLFELGSWGLSLGTVEVF